MIDVLLFLLLWAGIEQRAVEERALLDTLVLDVVLLEDDLRLVEECGKMGIPVRHPLAGRIAALSGRIAGAETRTTLPALKSRLRTQVVLPFRALRERAGSGPVSLAPWHPVSSSRIRAVLECMGERYSEARYEDVLILYEGCKLQPRFELTPGAVPVWERARELAESAERVLRLR